LPGRGLNPASRQGPFDSCCLQGLAWKSGRADARRMEGFVLFRRQISNVVSPPLSPFKQIQFFIVFQNVIESEVEFTYSGQCLQIL
jgi:hypothetical protein